MKRFAVLCDIFYYDIQSFSDHFIQSLTGKFVDFCEDDPETEFHIPLRRTLSFFIADSIIKIKPIYPQMQIHSYSMKTDCNTSFDPKLYRNENKPNVELLTNSINNPDKYIPYFLGTRKERSIYFAKLCDSLIIAGQKDVIERNDDITPAICQAKKENKDIIYFDTNTGNWS